MTTALTTKAEDKGLEEGPFPSGESHFSEPGNVRSNVNDAADALATHDPGLYFLIHTWPTLSQVDREAILAIVHEASDKEAQS